MPGPEPFLQHSLRAGSARRCDPEQVPTCEPLGAADAAWLGLDAPQNRMMITGLLFLDGQVDPADLRRLVQHRLIGTYPGFARRILPRRGRLRRPRWCDVVPDLDRHVVHHRLRTGDDQDLRRVVARLLSTGLDLDAAPWQLHLLSGYLPGPPGGSAGTRQSVVVARLHHSLADGMALAQVLLSLTDPEPAAPDAAATPRPPATPPERSGPAERAAPQSPVGLRRARVVTAAGAVRLGVDVFTTTVRLLVAPAEPSTSLRGPLGVPKHAAWSAPRDLDAVKRAARAMDATVNDVLLAATAGALRRHLHPVRVDRLRVFVPVDLRRGTPIDPRRLGNRFGLLPLLLPVGEPDLHERVRLVRERTRRAKTSRVPAATYLMIGLLSVLPVPLHRWVVRRLARGVTAVVTNVPGPPEPMTLAGAGLSGVVFWVPQTASVGVGLSIFSYAGTVRVGVAADVGLVPDPQALADLVDDELALLGVPAAIAPA